MSARMISEAWSAFDGMTFADPRILQICGLQWASLGEMRVADALATSSSLDIDSTLADKIPKLRRWAQASAVAPLDDLAMDLLTAWELTRQPIPKKRRRIGVVQRRTVRRSKAAPPLDPAARGAVMARLGLAGSAPVTLQQAADAAGLSRERVRQLCAQIEAVANFWLWAPALDEALRLADGRLTGDEYAQLLCDKGITRALWHPAAVESLARLCGRTDGVNLAVPDAALVAAIRQAATELVQRHCLASVADIAIAAGASLGRVVTQAQVRAELKQVPRFLAAGEWVGMSGPHQAGGRVSFVAGQLVAVAKHVGAIITVADVHYGLERRLRRDGIRHVPPVDAIASYLSQHPDFTLTSEPDPGEAVVELKVAPMALEQLIGDAALCLLELIRNSPGRVATRAELLEHAERAGVQRDAACQVLTYHEAFTRCGKQLWTITGLKPTQQAVDAAGSRVQPRNSRSEGRTAKGHPWWTVTVTAQWRRHKTFERRSMAAYPGRYRAIGPGRAEVGTITINRSGCMRGLYRYVINHDIPDGAELCVTVNPTTATATIEHR